jgi:hypothetical protein
MQAGLTRRQLTFREIFEAGIAFLASKNVLFVLSTRPRRSVWLLGGCLWRLSNI